MQDDVRAWYRDAQLLLDARALLHVGIHLVVEEAYGIPAVLPCALARSLGAAHQDVARRTVIRRDRYADVDGTRQIDAVDVQQLGSGEDEAMRQARRIVECADLRLQDREGAVVGASPGAAGGRSRKAGGQFDDPLSATPVPC